MKIEKDKVVYISYTLSSVDDDHQIVGHAPATEPFAYIHGHEFALPALEQHLEGLSKGDSFDFILTPEQGFGEYYEENMVDYPLQAFKDQNYPEELLKIGEIVPLQDEDGYPLDGVITAIDDKVVTIDFNHPFAGRNLHYQGKVLDVRNATSEEILQGIVKGM